MQSTETDSSLGRRVRTVEVESNEKKVASLSTIVVSKRVSEQIDLQELNQLITDYNITEEKNGRMTHTVIEDVESTNVWLLCYSISRGGWVVKKQWLTSVSEDGKLPPEDDFEASDILPGCYISRSRRKEGRMLFAGPKINVCPPSGMGGDKVEYLMDILRGVGIVPTNIDASDYCLCERYPEGPHVCGVTYVNMLWLTDSITAGHLKAVEQKYLPTTPCNNDVVACAIGRKPCFDSHIEFISCEDAIRMALVCTSTGGERLMEFVTDKYKKANNSNKSLYDILFLKMLSFALETGDFPFVKRLVGIKRDLIRMKDLRGETVLHMCLRRIPNLECFEWLLSMGAQIEEDSNGCYALEYIEDDTDLFLKFKHFSKFPYAARSKWFLDNIKRRYTVVLRSQRAFDMCDVKHLVGCILNNDHINLSNIFKVCPKIKLKYNGEIGDGDGVTRDWIQRMEELLQEHPSLYLTQNGTYYLSEGSRDTKFIGNLFGLVFFNQDAVRLSIPMCPLLFKFIVNEPLEADDIRHLDEELYQSKFKYLRSCSSEELDDLELTFTHVDYINESSSSIISSLKPSGDSIPVTKENLEEYLKLFAIHEIYMKRKTQIDEFLIGFNTFIPGIHFAKKVFTLSEVRSVLSGDGTPINVSKWRSVTVYDGMHGGSTLISWVWDVINDLSDEDRKQLLLFSTGSKFIPSKWTIALMFGDPSRLPTAQTCTSTLIIHSYRSKSMLRQRFSTLIEYQKTNRLGFQFV